MEIFFILRFKGSLGLPCFAYVCLESWFDLVFFLRIYVTFLEALYFYLHSCKVFLIGFYRSVTVRLLFEMEMLVINSMFLILPFI